LIQWFAVVIFFSPSGSPYLVDGWYPYGFPSRYDCEQGVESVKQQLEYVTEGDYEVGCVVAKDGMTAANRFLKYDLKEKFE